MMANNFNEMQNAMGQLSNQMQSMMMGGNQANMGGSQQNMGMNMGGMGMHGMGMGGMNMGGMGMNMGGMSHPQQHQQQPQQQTDSGQEAQLIKECEAKVAQRDQVLEYYLGLIVMLEKEGEDCAKLRHLVQQAKLNVNIVMEAKKTENLRRSNPMGSRYGAQQPSSDIGFQTCQKAMIELEKLLQTYN